MVTFTPKALFEERNDYRTYLADELIRRTGGSRGLKHKLAIAIGCQPGFVSQVLGKHAHFNLEHGEKINAFLEHTAEEGHYFLLLIQKTRAGTASLAAYFDRQLEEIAQRRLVLKNRLPADGRLGAEDQSRYYSAWYFGAIRVLLTIPEFRSKETIARRLHLSHSKVTEVMDFLVSRGLAREEGGQLLPTDMRLHLGNDSAMISKHHANWRGRALVSFDQEKEGDVHYSSVVSLSRKDATVLKEMTIQYLEKVKALVKESPAEEIYSFNMDFFCL